MEAKEKLLTIIVPIYNVEAYLNQCLDSLVYQTEKNFNAILVNDGSTDRSGEICEEYAEKYPEMFEYVYKENAGLGAARNTGMKHCKTKYVEFLDSDDWLLPRTVERIFERLEDETEDPDIIFMTPVVYNMATNKYEDWSDNEALKRIFEEVEVTNPQLSPEMYSLEASVNRCVWNFEFLKKHNFSFPEGVKWEDVAPHFYIFYWARRCIMVDNAGFCYRINSGTQITSSSDAGRLDVVVVFSKTLIYALENGWSTVEVSHIIKMMMSFARWSMAVSKKDVLPKLVKELHQLLSAIPERYIKAYEKQMHPGKDEQIIIKVLRSPGYRMFSNYHVIEMGVSTCARLGKVIRRRR